MQQFMPILFDASIKGFAVLLLAWGITTLMRRGSASARHMVWSGAIIATLAMPALSMLLPGLPFLPRIDWLTPPTTSTPATSGAGAGAQVQPSPGDSEAAMTERETNDTGLWSRIAETADLAGEGFAWPGGGGEVTSDATTPVEPIAAAPPEAAESPILSQPAAAATIADASTTSPTQSADPSWRVWLPRLWLAGCVLALLPLLLGWLSLWQLRRTATRVTAGPWHALLQQLAGEMRHAHPVVLLKSPCRSMPMTWGALAGLVPQWCAGLPGGAAVLLIPDDADDWSPQRQRAVLLHELAHIKRRDCLALLLTQLACAVYWFNPLVWLAARHMLIERERACDDMVLNRDTKASDNAQHLLDIATAPQAIQPGFFTSQAGIAMARKSKLDGRLVAILDQHRNRKALTRAGTLCIAGAIAVVTLLVACMQAEESPVVRRWTKADIRHHVANTGQQHNFTLTDAAQIEALASHFPRLGQPKKPSLPAARGSTLTITFHDDAGGMTPVSATLHAELPNEGLWADGRTGDYPIHDPAGLLAMIDALVEQTQKPDEVNDPAAMLPGLKARFAAVLKAAEGDDPAAVLRILEPALPDMRKLVAALEGSPAQQGVRMGVEMMEQVQAALKAGNMDEARALLQGVDAMGTELERLIRKPVVTPSYDSASLGAALESFLPAAREMAEKRKARELPMSVEALLARYPDLWTAPENTRQNVPDAIDTLDDMSRELPSLVNVIVSQYRDEKLDEVRLTAGQRVINAYIREIADARQPKSTAWSVEMNGIQVRLVAPEGTYVGSESLNPPIRMDVRNVSDKPVPLSTIQQRPYFRVMLPGRDRPNHLFASSITPWAMREGALNPGQTISWPLKLRDIVDLRSNENTIAFDLHASPTATYVDGQLPSMLVSPALRLIIDAPPMPLDAAWPVTWNDSLELTMHVTAGVWGQMVIQIDGTGELTLLHEMQQSTMRSIPRGRYQTKLTQRQLDGLAKAMHDAEVWKLSTTPRTPAPPPSDAMALGLRISSGARSFAMSERDPRQSHAALQATYNAIVALLKEIEAQLEPDNVWTPAADAGPANEVDDAAPLSRFGRILAEQPEPKIEGLRERAAPDVHGDVSTEAFFELLKLRDLKLKEAVPELIAVLEANRDSSLIHRFAAEQALFVIGTPQAHEALRESMLKANYDNVDSAFGYTTHWEMPEPDRSDFIRQYLLRNLSDDLRLTAEARWEDGKDGRELVVNVTATNVANQPIMILRSPHYLATGLYLESPEGVFAPRQEYVQFDSLASVPHVLASGESFGYRVVLLMDRVPRNRVDVSHLRRMFGDNPRVRSFLASDDTAFGLSSHGEYRLYAVIEQREAAGVDKDAMQHWWTGRAVSKPVTVAIEPDRKPAADGKPDPVSLLPGMKARFAAIDKAIEGNDAAAALRILEAGMPELQKLVTALEGSPAQPGVRTAVEMMDQVRDALKAGHMVEARALLEGVGVMAFDLGWLIRESQQPVGDAVAPKAPVALADLPLRWGQAVEGLQVGLAVPQQPMVAGQPYEVRWAIRNAGDVPRTIVWHELHHSPVYFEVGAKGEVARIRDDSLRRMSNRFPTPPIAVVLAPGQSKEAAFDLSWFLDRDRRMNPGDYEVRGLYVPWHGRAASYRVESMKRPEFKDAVVSRIDSATLSFKIVAGDAAAAGAQAPLADLPLQWGKAVKGLQVGLAIPQQPMVAGQPYEVRWAIRNTGDVPRTIVWHENHYSPVYFEVGAKGEVATIRARFLPVVTKPGPPTAVVLEPGQSKESTFDLTHFQPNSMNPGDYEVRGLYFPSDKQGATFRVEYLKRPEFKDAVISRIDSATLSFKVVAAAPLPATAPTAPAANEESAAME